MAQRYGVSAGVELLIVRASSSIYRLPVSSVNVLVVRAAQTMVAAYTVTSLLGHSIGVMFYSSGRLPVKRADPCRARSDQQTCVVRRVH